MQRNEQVSEFKEKLVAVNRVSKTVKGGRNMRFSALMVVGDENGRVGCGMGKAVEIPEAIRKGTEDAKKSMITVPMKGTTIPHEVVGVFGTGKIKMLPAPEGTGVIAGGPVRAVLEAVGIKDIVTKSTIACLKDQIATIKALGLHHVGHTVVKADNPATRGMIFKVKHMVKVEEIAD